jgi:tetrahydromethanopterin S-methyltransferase subunit H
MNTKDLIKEVRELMSKFNFNNEEVKMESAVLTDGTVIKWDGTLAVGTAILVETAEGDIPAPDATHEVEGGLLVTTLDGMVTEIVEPADEEVEAEKEMVKEFATVERFNEVVASLEGKISFLTEQFAKVVSALEKQGEAFSKTVDLVEKVANLPSEAPMNVDQTKVSKKDQQFENIKKFAQQLKN